MTRTLWLAWLVSSGCATDPQHDPDEGVPVNEPDDTDEAAILSVALTASATTVSSGSVTFTAEVTSTLPVDSVELHGEDGPIATLTDAPYTHDLTFVAADNGVRTFTAIARDAEGQVAESAPVELTVAINLPCGADAALCTLADCDLCIAPTHVKDVGTWISLEQLEDASILGDVRFEGETGAIRGIREPNADPRLFEVVAGIGFVVQDQETGPPLAVWSFRSLILGDGKVTIAGHPSVALVASHDLTVTETVVIDVSADGLLPGPGGGTGGFLGGTGAGCAGGLGQQGSAGGGGYGSDGGDGSVFPGSGGRAGDCADPVVLHGGSGGGGGEDGTGAVGRWGGGGGGALQLTALGSLEVAGSIDAGGGGARITGGNWRSGSGGGSGGTIFLESPSIAVLATAGLYANGGGGGSSSDCGLPGEDARPGLLPAPGGACQGRSGGRGAAGLEPATPGRGTGGVAGEAGGGGGGGHGRIVLSTSATATPTVLTTELSPPTELDAYEVRTGLGTPSRPGGRSRRNENSDCTGP